MGIIGFGRIGQAEGRIAKALGMNVIAYDSTRMNPAARSRITVTQDEPFRRRLT